MLGGVCAGVMQQAPLPRGGNATNVLKDLARQYSIPYGGLLEMLSSVDPSELGDSGSLFAKPLSQIPVVNEWLAEQVRTGRAGPRSAGRGRTPAATQAGLPAWMRD